MVYFGFAIADSMFPEKCVLSRVPLTPEEVKKELPFAVMCLNPSHKPTCDAAVSRFGLAISIPAKAPQVALKPGDVMLVMSVRGLPRLEGRHEYTAEEINNATFVFASWLVVGEG